MRDALPNASFIGFTGTPLELTDKNTRAVFGDYIKPIYDIRQAVEDGATVPIYYESRLAKLGLDQNVLPIWTPSSRRLLRARSWSQRRRSKPNGLH
jgi:type I restriction enzyme R subunit